MLDERIMKCPYCNKVFWITEDERCDNETFECSHCHQVNAGCSEADQYGVLIGVSILDYEIVELLRG